jgi:hypothetical protein
MKDFNRMSNLETEAENGCVSATEVAPTLFHEAWWLEAASGGKIENVSVVCDGRAVASLFFVRRNTLGVRQIRMPPYTRMLGPTFSLPPSKPSTRLMNIRRLTHELIDQLPPHDHFLQILPSLGESAFAFSVAGFAEYLTYSFRVDQDVEVADLWVAMDQKTRNAIRSAGRRWFIRRHYDFDKFQKLSIINHTANLNDFALLRQLFSVCLAKDRTIILSAEDDRGQDAASAILIWGAGTAYYFLSARNPAMATGGINSLLLWHGLEFAKERNLAFDFDSYRSRAGALFLEKFGLVPVSRPIVLRVNNSGRWLDLGGNILHRCVRVGSGDARWYARLTAKASSTLLNIARTRGP